ncbi:hypothetical protein T06_7998 [Trichinella sp. T6]|nr:hypothetical protein T06_7998 [Trichinella sp. T6]
MSRRYHFGSIIDGLEIGGRRGILCEGLWLVLSFVVTSSCSAYRTCKPLFYISLPHQQNFQLFKFRNAHGDFEIPFILRVRVAYLSLGQKANHLFTKGTK